MRELKIEDSSKRRIEFIIVLFCLVLFSIIKECNFFNGINEIVFYLLCILFCLFVYAILSNVIFFLLKKFKE